MKILVTGGAGFIGANFVNYWVKKYQQDDVVNLDKLTYAGNLENLKDLVGAPNYTFVKGDIVDEGLIDKLMSGIDVVVHFAAETHVDRSILDPSPFIRTNIDGTFNLLKSALKNKVKRFHHISTDEVFGSLDLGSSQKFDELSAYNPSSPYAASKAASDYLVRAYYITYGLPITISNCSNNFGPYQFPEKMISLAVTNIIEGKKIPIYGDGKYSRDWLYVSDHVEAIERVLEQGKIGETYLIGGMTQEISNIEVAKKILTLTNKDESSIELVKDRPGHDRKYAIDWTKINRELGWKPKHDFESAMALTVEWYKKNQDWWRRVKSGEYHNYYKKQYESVV